MSRLQSTGYLVTPVSIAWTSGQGLASLDDNEWTDLSDEIDNSSNKYVLADFEVVLASAAFTGADSALEMYLVRSQDGTNYPTWTTGTSDEQENQANPSWSRATTGTTAAQRLVFEDIPLPPGKYKVAFRNRGGVTTAASGNTATFRPHSVEMSA